MKYYQAIIQTPVGVLGIQTDLDYLVKIDYLTSSSPLQQPIHSFAKRVVQQLHCYFKNADFTFTIPYQLHGTVFQKKVWIALTQLPVGKAKHYGALAKQLSTAARAIGNACRHNPLPIIIPCHRIIAQKGLGGYAGSTQCIQAKLWLLKHEGFINTIDSYDELLSPVHATINR